MTEEKLPAVSYQIHRPDLTQLTGTICPRPELVFKAIDLVSPEEARVVILGLAPYQQAYADGTLMATGLPFANAKGRGLSPSLQIIQEELLRCNLGDIGECPELLHWAEQGVLSLNAALTVELNGDPKGHLKFWKNYIRAVLKAADKENLVVALLGKDASSFSGCFKKALVIKAAHPAADSYGNRFIFRGSDVFQTINDLLINTGQVPVNWVLKNE